MEQKGDQLETKYNSLFEIPVTDIDGKEMNLQTLASGKKCILVVNVASACGLTDANYK